jgi:hypothetical protein
MATACEVREVRVEVELLWLRGELCEVDSKADAFGHGDSVRATLT